MSLYRLLFIPLSMLTSAALAATVDIHLFWAVGCPHCERAIDFADRLAAENSQVTLRKLEVSRSRENAALMLEAATRLGVEAGSVPLTVVGDRAWVGSPLQRYFYSWLLSSQPLSCSGGSIGLRRCCSSPLSCGFRFV